MFTPPVWARTICSLLQEGPERLQQTGGGVGEGGQVRHMIGGGVGVGGGPLALPAAAEVEGHLP